jgi:rhamnosyltransferase
MTSKSLKKCSIIIRTKNEERWISSCLSSVFDQTYKNIEIIIVDNESTDKTIKRTKKFKNIKYVNISKYFPGDALNKGIEASTGDYIVCLSGHCIPVNKYWLENLVSALEENENYAGVYGRQEPMSFSTPSDKRDLLLVFGLDRKIQKYDSFFHNANSILRKSLWTKIPFDSQITNIEDRIWGQEMISLGYKLLYEPKASVYHYHGIHQDGNLERCNSVVKIIQNMQSNVSDQGLLNPSEMLIIALIPIKGEDLKIGDKSQMSFTIESALKSMYIDRVIVTTNNLATARAAEKLGAECPFIRSDSLAMDFVSLDTVLKDAMDHLDENEIYPDLIVSLEATFPFRGGTLVDDIINHTLNSGFDTVIAAKRESASLWQESENEEFKRLDSGNTPRLYKEKSYIGLRGLCCVTHPEFLRQENLFEGRVGLYEINQPLSFVEVRDKDGRETATKLISNYNFGKNGE